MLFKQFDSEFYILLSVAAEFIVSFIWVGCLCEEMETEFKNLLYYGDCGKSLNSKRWLVWWLFFSLAYKTGVYFKGINSYP